MRSLRGVARAAGYEPAADRASRPWRGLLRRQLGQLALDGGDVLFLARNRRTHPGDPIEVLLIVALVAQALGLAVVELLLHVGQSRLLALELGFQQLARVGVPLALRGRVHLALGLAFARPRRHRRRLAVRLRLRRLHDRHRSALDRAAVALLGLLRRDLVGVEDRRAWA